MTTLKRAAGWLLLTAAQIAAILALRTAAAYCAGKLLAAW